MTTDRSLAEAFGLTEAQLTDLKLLLRSANLHSEASGPDATHAQTLVAEDAIAGTARPALPPGERYLDRGLLGVGGWGRSGGSSISDSTGSSR
ncbi:MAG: hypothetical protein ACI8S6_002888 [Myxococcota bacterium]|jgi:hypothetical protein